MKKDLQTSSRQCISQISVPQNIDEKHKRPDNLFRLVHKLHKFSIMMYVGPSCNNEISRNISKVVKLWYVCGELCFIIFPQSTAIYYSNKKWIVK